MTFSWPPWSSHSSACTPPPRLSIPFHPPCHVSSEKAQSREWAETFLAQMQHLGFIKGGTVFDWSTIWSTIPVSIPSQGKNYSLSLIFGKCSETFVSPLDVWSIFGNLRNVTEYLQKMVKNVVFSIFIKYTKQDTGARGFEISLLSRCAHPWEIERSTRRQISYLRAPMS